MSISLKSPGGGWHAGLYKEELLFGKIMVRPIRLKGGGSCRNYMGHKMMLYWIDLAVSVRRERGHQCLNGIALWQSYVQYTPWIATYEDSKSALCMATCTVLNQRDTIFG